MRTERRKVHARNTKHFNIISQLISVIKSNATKAISWDAQFKSVNKYMLHAFVHTGNHISPEEMYNTLV